MLFRPSFVIFALLRCGTLVSSLNIAIESDTVVVHEKKQPHEHDYHRSEVRESSFLIFSGEPPNTALTHHLYHETFPTSNKNINKKNKNKNNQNKKNQINNYTIKNMKAVSSTIEKDISKHQTTHRSLQSSLCVYNETDLRNAIDKIPESLLPPTQIDLCSNIITITNVVAVLNNKFINFICNIPNNTTEKCTLDAQNMTRHFNIINNTNISFNRIDFVNGYADNKSNIAERDGGSFQIQFSNVQFNKCNFVNNTAMNSGGAMRIANSVIQMNNCHFINNNVRDSGAALYVFDSNINMKQCNIINNKGGLLFGGRGVIDVRDSNLTLIGNDNETLPTIYKDNSGSFGGVISAVNSDITAVEGFFLFRNNHASGGPGGAILTGYSISSWNNVVFVNNTAVTSGGVFFQDHGEATMNNITFNNNYARLGGAVVCLNATTLFDNVVFNNNTALVEGGAIFSRMGSITTVNDSFFYNSNASEGGAISIASSVTSINNVIFDSNKADKGGAIFSLDGSTTICNDASFFNNEAGSGGAAFGVNDCTLIFNNAVFENNTAKDEGAAVKVEDGFLLLYNVNAVNNIAPNGTIALISSKVDIREVSFFRPTSDWDSCDVFFSVEGDDGTFLDTRVNFRPSPPPQTRKAGRLQIRQQTCITNDNEFREAIVNCNETTTTLSCMIEVCQPKIQITSPNGNARGIDVSNKNILVTCSTSTPSERCVLDGANKSSLFYGSNTSMAFQNFIFANGVDDHAGGAINMTNSFISLSNCSFWNNSAPFGSAISVKDTELIIDGEETSIVSNRGNGSPIQVFTSLFNISHAVFADNGVSEYGSAIFVFGSVVNIANVTSVKSEEDDFCGNCDVYVTLDSNDFSQQSSCLSFDDNSKPFPVIDLAKECAVPTVSASPSSSPTVPMSIPTVSPKAPKTFSPVSPTGETTNSPVSPTGQPAISPVSAVAPTTTPSPRRVICFSGDNTVEVQHKGQIQMSQLQIGDYVKSGDGTFTQVYGFGHFDHERDETFLQFDFEDFSSVNEADNVVLNTFLVISQYHLVFLNDDINRYSIPAADVIVGYELSGKKVTAIHSVTRRGVYAPLTRSGDIVVNGIVTSNYVDVFSRDHSSSLNHWDLHIIGHAAFYAQRNFCYYFIEICKKERYINGYGILAYFIMLGSDVLQNTYGCLAIAKTNNQSTIESSDIIVIASIFSIIFVVVNVVRAKLDKKQRQRKVCQ